MAPNIPDTLDLERMATLLHHRTEEPEVEYKSWMDLSSAENKSKIAKHLCALANYGGGWLVFGINDDGSHAEPYPGNLDNYKQDIINAIVSRYLHPPFHCRVHLVTSRLSQNLHPVVQVPPHGAQPICAKTDGPLVGKQRVGVAQGVHYIRTSGPQSVPVDRPELWQQLLHRCVVRERESLLASISNLFTPSSVVVDKSSLDDLCEELLTDWNTEQWQGWLVDAAQNRTVLGFQFLQSHRQPVTTIALSRLKEAIREASKAADDECNAQPTFDITYRGSTSPSVVVRGETEGFGVAAVQENGLHVFAPALWRLFANGVGAEVRPYHEDTDWVRRAMQNRSSRPWAPGAHLSPRFQAARIYELVAFVRHLSATFEDAQLVRLIVDYGGLAGRTIRDTRASGGFNRTSSVGARRFSIETTVESLVGTGTADTVAKLLNPILRLFDGCEVNSEFIQTTAREIS